MRITRILIFPSEIIFARFNQVPTSDGPLYDFVQLTSSLIIGFDNSVKVQIKLYFIIETEEQSTFNIHQAQVLDILQNKLDWK